MRVSLTAHPTTPDSPVKRIEVEVARNGGELTLAFDVSGDVDAVKAPPLEGPGRRDGLWRQTCFEAFIKGKGDSYFEFNLSPSHRWAGYGFTGYREGQAMPRLEQPEIAFGWEQGRLWMEALVFLPPEALGKLGLSAVIEDVDGRISYWALVHPSDKPDFHHPDSFVLDLP